MAKGGRRQYARDASGRFSSSGSTRAARPPAQRVRRGTNRLTRDNAGRITGTGNGATARGGRLRTAGGNLRATQTARLKGAGGKVRRPIGGGAKKPVGWMQSPAARADRLALGKDRSREAAFLRSLPKETRKANRLASKTRNQSFGQKHKVAISEGMTALRSNFGKRKGMAPGAVESINKAIQFSGKKIRVAMAVPVPGRRLAKSKSGKAQKPVSLGRQSGTIAKPKGLKPQPAAKLKKEIAYSRMREVNRRMANKADTAQVNITGRFTGQAGKRFSASIDRAVAQVSAQQRAQMFKPKEQVKAEAAARKAAKDAAALAKPKRVRSPESLRASRAKQVEKRRSISINPAGWSAESAVRMAANAARTQQRALAFYKAKPTTKKRRKP